MSTANKRYGRKFRLEIIRRIQASGQSRAEIARELDVDPDTISHRMRQYRERKAEVFPGKGSQTSRAALIPRLCREIERLRHERDIYTNVVFWIGEEPDAESTSVWVNDLDGAELAVPVFTPDEGEDRYLFRGAGCRREGS